MTEEKENVKVKSYLCLFKYHNTKSMGSEVTAQIILTQALDEG
jgi:hypothetical protein